MKSLTVMNKASRNKFVRELCLAAVVVVDALIFFGSLVAGFLLRFRLPLDSFLYTAPHTIGDFAGHFVLGTLSFLGIAAWMGIYQKSNLLRFQRASFYYLQICTFWALVYLLFTLLIRFQPEVSRLYVLFAFFVSFPALCIGRKLMEAFFNREAVARSLRQRIVVVGWTEESEKFVASISEAPNHPYEVLGCVPLPKIGLRYKPDKDVAILGTYDNIPDILKSLHPDIVILADIDLSTGEIITLAENCYRELVQFKVIPSFFQILISSLRLETVGGVPVLGVEDPPIVHLHNRILKRTVDIVGSLVGLAIGLPFIMFFGFLVWCESPGPIFYKQRRVGGEGRIFPICKIRSMKPSPEDVDHGWTVPHDPRVLKIGTFIRRWNIDEIPQFWNVLMGDMSLVGPRPEQLGLIETFKGKVRYYNLRHGIKPGMTGWAQIHGWRGDTDLEERIRFDLYYAENWSLWLDIYIMFFTLIRYKNAY